jgi:hypothetical protein
VKMVIHRKRSGVGSVKMVIHRKRSGVGSVRIVRGCLVRIAWRERMLVVRGV